MRHILIGFLCIFFLGSCGSTSSGNPEVNNSEKIILALGDSITIGYGLNIEESYPSQLAKLLGDNNFNYKIINAGIIGNTSKDLLDRIMDYDEIKADIYLLTIGGNDGLRKKSVPEMAINIESIIDHLQSINPEAKIVLSGMKIPIQFGFTYSRNFNKSFESITDNKKIYFYEYFLEDVSGYAKLNLSDNIHPNAEGYKIISQNIYDFLEDEYIIIK